MPVCLGHRTRKEGGCDPESGGARITTGGPWAKVDILCMGQGVLAIFSEPNVAVALLFRILQVPGSILSQKTGYL